MKANILTVQESNKLADKMWTEYCNKCDANKVPYQKRNNFRKFIKFPFNQGFVIQGKYPLYYRTKKQALKTLGLA